ncbi:Fic family protein [Lentzea atacamensis]|uniref:Fic family protein n=1 Tax=Lentzea atacamensis TaxID=531938 RepID=A0ABX9DYG8_9PSEU|nr:Fic family protein [Lentzea atacamensis]RAS58895.1 Fic family protein [Lentzea atacamensis]
MPTSAADIESAGHYQPFVSFQKWIDFDHSRGISPNVMRLDAALRSFTESTTAAQSQVVERVNKRLARQAAAESVAVEGFYELKPGESRSIAVDAANWQQILSRQSDVGEMLFSSQLDAFDYVSLHIQEGSLVTERFVRELHEISCKAQDTYTVHVPNASGGYTEQQRALRKGEYKDEQNVVTQRGGNTFWYCPPELVPVEMSRFIDELRSSRFVEFQPQYQIAYAHYALVHIHPFSDGNGRVARALASYYSQLAFGVPFIVYSDRKQTYFQALEATGRGDWQMLTEYVEDRTILTLDFARREVNSTGANTPEAQTAHLIATIEKHRGEVVANLLEVSQSVRTVLEQKVRSAVAKISDITKDSGVRYTVEDGTRYDNPGGVGYGVAAPITKLIVSFAAIPEAYARTLFYTLYTTDVAERFCVEVAVADGTLSFYIGGDGRHNGTDSLGLQYEDCHPTLTSGTVDQIDLLVDSAIAATIARLQEKMHLILRRAGRLDPP